MARRKPNSKPQTKSATQSKSNSVTTKGKSNSKSGRSMHKTGSSIKEVVLAPKSAGLPVDDRDNDPNWYFTSAELAEQASQLSFQQMIGAGPLLQNAYVPPCMIINFNPSPGNCYTSAGDHGIEPESLGNSGVNIMAHKIYTLLSTYSGRTANYGPQDVAIMLLALGSMIEFEEYIRRMFGICLTYNQRNRFVPLNLLEALGVSSNDMLKNNAAYRMRFNIDINRVNQIPLLDNIGFLRKCRDMYQKVYVDAPSALAQLYVYKPASIWILSEEGNERGSILRTIPIPSGNLGNLLAMFEQQIESLLNSSTLNIIYADLINLGSKVQIDAVYERR